jgi:hypothetical protein
MVKIKNKLTTILNYKYYIFNSKFLKNYTFIFSRIKSDFVTYQNLEMDIITPLHTKN